MASRLAGREAARRPLTIPPAQRLTSVRGDGQSTWSFSLFRDFRIWERLQAQLRAEAYNAMNHTSFNNPDMSVTNSNFGVVTQAASEPRSWQFGLKLLF